MQRIVNLFAEKGHDVHLITRWSPLLPGLYNQSIQIHAMMTKFIAVFRIAPRQRFLFLALLGPIWFLQIRSILHRVRPDVLSCQYITGFGYLGALLGFHPFILTPWGSDIFLDPQRNVVLRIMTRYSLRKADLVICDSEAMKRSALELDARAETLHLVSYVGVDTSRFSPDRRNPEIVKKLGNTNSLFVISVRNLTPNYNVEMVVKAAPHILRRVPDTRFIICGEGEQRRWLEQLAISLGVQDHMVWMGWVPRSELPQYLAASDIYVSTSLSDSTSVSLLEAMACQLASVVTDVPANREWISHGENGYVVPQGDVTAFAEHVTQLLESEELRKRFGAKSRIIIQRRAEERDQLDKLEGLYLSTGEKKNESNEFPGLEPKS